MRTEEKVFKSERMAGHIPRELKSTSLYFCTKGKLQQLTFEDNLLKTIMKKCKDSGLRLPHPTAHHKYTSAHHKMVKKEIMICNTSRNKLTEVKVWVKINSSQHGTVKKLVF